MPMLFLMVPLVLAQTADPVSTGVHFDVPTLVTILTVAVNGILGLFLWSVRKKMAEMASKEWVEGKIANDILKSREDIVELKGKVNSIDDSLHGISTSLRDLNNTLMIMAKDFMRREDCKYFHEIKHDHEK